MWPDHLPRAKPTWWEVLGVTARAGRDEIEAAYRAKAKKAHPDTGGSNEAMAMLTAARDEALRAIR